MSAGNLFPGSSPADSVLRSVERGRTGRRDHFRRGLEHQRSLRSFHAVRSSSGMGLLWQLPGKKGEDLRYKQQHSHRGPSKEGKGLGIPSSSFLDNTHHLLQWVGTTPAFLSSLLTLSVPICQAQCKAHLMPVYSK